MIKSQKMMPVTTVLDHALTAADLQYAKILILNDPQSKPLPPKNYTAAEITGYQGLRRRRRIPHPHVTGRL